MSDREKMIAALKTLYLLIGQYRTELVKLEQRAVTLQEAIGLPDLKDRKSWLEEST
jgi:hypothetical protein